MQYVALLRGINVGGNNLIKMSELKACIDDAGFYNVRTYIQSGNILFETDESDVVTITRRIEQAITDMFHLTIPVVVMSQSQLEKVIREAPKSWGESPEWKHNLLFLRTDVDANDALESIGVLKSDIELVVAGEGALYQSILTASFSRSRSGKLASMPIYQQMTIRNYNTATKLLYLMQNS